MVVATQSPVYTKRPLSRSRLSGHAAAGATQRLRRIEEAAWEVWKTWERKAKMAVTRGIANDSGRIVIKVLLFARAAEIAGARSLDLEITAGGTIGDLQDTLIAQCPQLAQLAEASRWAVANHFVATDYPIEHDKEIAFIPPVSGG